MKNGKILIGTSDYTREQMQSGINRWTIGSPKEFLETIESYEEEGYTVKFKTSPIRRIFGLGIYKVIAYPKKTQ